MARTLNQGIGGRVIRPFAYLTHSSSVIFPSESLRFVGYVVPHGPRYPSVSPLSLSLSAAFPPALAYPAVWQSLQPPISTTYRPRSSCCAFGDVVCLPACAL